MCLVGRRGSGGLVGGSWLPPGGWVPKTSGQGDAMRIETQVEVMVWCGRHDGFCPEEVHVWADLEIDPSDPSEVVEVAIGCVEHVFEELGVGAQEFCRDELVSLFFHRLDAQERASALDNPPPLAPRPPSSRPAPELRLIKGGLSQEAADIAAALKAENTALAMGYRPTWTAATVAKEIAKARAKLEEANATLRGGL